MKNPEAIRVVEATLVDQNRVDQNLVQVTVDQKIPAVAGQNLALAVADQNLGPAAMEIKAEAVVEAKGVVRLCADSTADIKFLVVSISTTSHVKIKFKV